MNLYIPICRYVGPPSIQFHKHNWGVICDIFLVSLECFGCSCNLSKYEGINKDVDINTLVGVNGYMLAGCVAFSIGFRAYSGVCLYLFIQHIFVVFYIMPLYYYRYVLWIFRMYKHRLHIHIK